MLEWVSMKRLKELFSLNLGLKVRKNKKDNIRGEGSEMLDWQLLKMKKLGQSPILGE